MARRIPVCYAERRSVPDNTSIDPLVLECALGVAPSAVGYHIGRVLGEYAGRRSVVEVGDAEFDLVDAEFDLGEFALESGCPVEPLHGIHQQTSVSWARRGRLHSEREIFWVTTRWHDRAVEVIGARWQEGFHSRRRHWVIAEDRAAAEAFVTAVLDAIHLPARRVLVYSGACWSRDEQLYATVQLASWDELVLPGDLAQRIREDVSSFLGARELYARYGVPYKRGVLLTGPPGNGKTHCVRALMKDVRLPTLYVRSFDARYGEIDGNIQSVFARARRIAPCLLVLEDLENLVKPPQLSVFLNELDGIRADTGILTLATSNHPERLDPALVERPSRFDRKYHLDLPAVGERRRYLHMWIDRLEPEMRIAADVVQRLAERSDGFSYAFLKELVLSSMVRWMNERGDMAAVLEVELAHLRRHMQRPAPEPANTPEA
jgi:hypothetical protein